MVYDYNAGGDACGQPINLIDWTLRVDARGGLREKPGQGADPGSLYCLPYL
jgi:hypothetical protein